MTDRGNLHYAPIINRKAKDTLLKSNPQLDEVLANSRKNGLPAITIGPLAGQYLAIQCQLINAKSILEIGTLGGYSTNWLASTGAKVTCIEISPKHRDVAVENCKGLDVDIILGDALEVLPKLHGEGQKYDLVFIDADWGNQFEYFQWATKLTRSNGCIFIDNVVRELLDTDPEAKNENLLTKVGREKGVTATLITTLGPHQDVDNNFDGFLIAVVK